MIQLQPNDHIRIILTRPKDKMEVTGKFLNTLQVGTESYMVMQYKYKGSGKEKPRTAQSSFRVSQIDTIEYSAESGAKSGIEYKPLTACFVPLDGTEEAESTQVGASVEVEVKAAATQLCACGCGEKFTPSRNKKKYASRACATRGLLLQSAVAWGKKDKPIEAAPAVSKCTKADDCFCRECTHVDHVDGDECICNDCLVTPPPTAKVQLKSKQA